MSVVIPENRSFWIDFIRLFKSLPELWNPKIEAYRDKTKKLLAFGKLFLSGFIAISENSTIDIVFYYSWCPIRSFQ